MRWVWVDGAEAFDLPDDLSCDWERGGVACGSQRAASFASPGQCGHFADPDFGLFGFGSGASLCDGGGVALGSDHGPESRPILRPEEIQSCFQETGTIAV